ncbi:hypothetical protein RJZ56_001459 [Blastomyces dermatitidis]|uniref:Uncharacterized protein n=2 Tax=Ajellomyces dermatitidis TaxID=5039 RepID=F2T2H4_AJEDA|nr:uncharacterized protein BDCG_03865 [Blastomyces dermatitidis ER-3]EEQ88745.1 hypothetical protein BDCG_03865 [Blastomyces dermatitidis ER-3]EGE77084.1 hypothetical protein BDDG_00021 [Blastomyces dermatitidis ATCC 18188]
MGNGFPSKAGLSPWLISFEGGPISERFRVPSVGDQIENDRRELGLRDASQGLITPNSASHFADIPHTQAYLNSNISAPSPTAPTATIISIDSFYVLAVRAYQESVRFPDSPPPSVWAPGDQLHPYYTQILSAFFDNFHAQLQQQQLPGFPTIMSRDAFHDEWLKHSRSVLDNIRADWSKRPQGSRARVLATTIAVRSTANNTAYRPVANVALQQTMAQPTAPPKEGWRKGQPLHPYYELMLRRFEDQLGRLLEAEFGGPVMFEGGRTLQAETFEFEVIIMREYRKMWIEIFG